MSRTVAISVLAVIAAVLIGAVAYQAGVSQGIVTSGEAGAVADGRYGYHPGGFGWGFGFPFLGLLFPILFFFLIFGLVRAAFWGGPRWGGPWEDRRTMAAEWHDKLHAEAGKRNEPGTERRDQR